MRRNTSVSVRAVLERLLASFAFLLTVALTARAALGLDPGAAPEERPVPVKTEARRTTALAEAFADVASLLSPSVVEIRSGGLALGFGAAIDDGTVVLTSRSILERAKAGPVTVLGGAGQSASASILGGNEAYDVALLELKGLKLPPLKPANPGELAVGQWVITIGIAPRPLAVGVVSALGRRVEPRGESSALDLFGLFSDNAGPRRAYGRVIQHDSPIDGDKMGAPLVSATGSLIGINIANVYRGTSYAAPMDDVQKFIGDLRAGKSGPATPRPGFIGVTIGGIRNRDVARAVEVLGPGAEIHDVAADLPAAKAGLRPGDVVVSVLGERIQSIEHFGQIIRGTCPGERVRIRVLRAGSNGKTEVEVLVTVVASPGQE